MIRATTTVSAAALLALAALAPTTAASAAGETCQGRAATHVGSPQTSRITGTEGADVIVTNGALGVDALGGDDVICVTGGYGNQVFAGAGNDLVDASTLGSSGAQVRLGAGSDRFLGGPGSDFVWAGDEDGLGTADTEPDVIEMGAPASSSTYDAVRTGQAGQPNGDVVRMGIGAVSWAGTPTATTVLDGGAGSTLAMTLGETDAVRLDNVAGTMSTEGQPTLSFTGFTGFDLLAPKGPRSFAFTGSDRDEELELQFWRTTGGHDVRTGGGDDEVHVYSYDSPAVPDRASYDAGPGRDLLRLTLPDEVDADVDLRRGRLALGRGRDEVTHRARGFEDTSAMTEDVEVVGTSGRNRVSVYACRSRVDARGGKDRVDTFDEVMDKGLRCSGVRARFAGGGGNDELTGSTGRDVLLGGPGRDTVDGSAGRDVCQGEKLRRCEKRA